MNLKLQNKFPFSDNYVQCVRYFSRYKVTEMDLLRLLLLPTILFLVLLDYGELWSDVFVTKYTFVKSNDFKSIISKIFLAYKMIEV